MAAVDTKRTAVVNSKKRAKILSSKHTMFLWVAGMSAVVGVCVVLSWMLLQQAIFNGKVLSEKQATVKTLKANNDVLAELKSNVRLQETSQALLDNRASEDENAVQVILDALPAQPNPLALGSSVQNVLAGTVGGITVEALTVDPVSDEVAQAGEVGTVPFTLEVTADSAEPVREVLNRFEHSIRIIDIDSLVVSVGESEYRATIKAHAYYAEAKTVELQDKVVKP